ncbi:MAG: hypothetical protein BIFFINMI_02931 [Phycisphaerae bacterium]|nr:hypothetical protein [Phycisphaerae bacterium]
MTTNTTTPYALIRPRVRCGDVILLDGKGAAAGLIKRQTGSLYSHCGLACWVAGVGGVDRPRLMMIESTTLNDQPDVTGEIRRGVQMHLLSQVAAACDGRMWWAPLRRPLADGDRHAMVRWLTQQHASAVPYDMLGALQAGLDWWERQPLWLRVLTFPLAWTRSRRPDLRRLFCSELVTRALQVAGRVDASVNPSEQTPADVAKFDCLGPAEEIE